MAPAVMGKKGNSLKRAAAEPAVKGAGRKKVKRETPHRTSIGGRHAPLNKHKRRSWKRYRGQGRPR